MTTKPTTKPRTLRGSAVARAKVRAAVAEVSATIRLEMCKFLINDLIEQIIAEGKLAAPVLAKKASAKRKASTEVQTSEAPAPVTSRTNMLKTGKK